MCVFDDNFLLSVIIPTYNGGYTLRKPIDSIISQSLGFEDNIELIIVDDGSTDSVTSEVILEYKSRYPNNIKTIFLKRNSQYPGKPRNIALDYVTGDYIIFSDDDDSYKKDAFKILYEDMVKYKSDMVMGRYQHVDGKFKRLKKSREDFIDIDPLDDQEIFDILSIANGGGTCAKLYNKEWLLSNNIKFLENGNMEDVHFHLNVLLNADRVTFFINEPVYTYYIYDDSSIHSHNKNLVRNMVGNMYEIAVLLKKVDLDVNYFLSHFMSQILLVFSNLDSSDKKLVFNDIYELERYLEDELEFNTDFKRLKEVSILNNAIMDRKFKKVIFLSSIYKKLYNNKIIQRFYKKFREE